MSDEVEKLVYLDRDRGWQLPFRRDRARRARTAARLLAMKAERDKALRDLDILRAKRARTARLTWDLHRERNSLSEMLDAVSADHDEALRERDAARQRADAAVSNQHMLALESQTFEYERDEARRERDEARAERNDYARRLAATDDAWRVLSIERDELRAILAPLLDAPYPDPRDGSWPACRFCEGIRGRPHTPDCLILRKDALLGRET